MNRRSFTALSSSSTPLLPSCRCLRKLSIVCVPVIFETGSRHQLLYAMAITFLTFGAYATIMPYAQREANFYALAAQASSAWLELLALC